MKFVRPSSVAEVVAEFLKAEIDGDRWATAIRSHLAGVGLAEAAIRTPNLQSVTENAARAQVLGSFRGWGRNTALFAGFPTDVAWWQYQLEPGDSDDLRVANYPDWVVLSGGTRRVRDAATNVKAENFPAQLEATASRIRAIQRRLEKGESVGVPILVALTTLKPLTIVEGHSRLVAWFLSGRDRPFPVIVGTTTSLKNWRWA